MKNIDPANPFKTTLEENEFGIISTLTTDIGISTHGAINFDGKTLLANYISKEGELYDLHYTLVDTNGNQESFIQRDGLSPTLFLSPDGEAYVSVITHEHKELEISTPVFNRENIERLKGNRPFVGDFIGVINQFSVFYNVDVWSATKPDKLLAIEFKNGSIKKKHNVKVPLPRRNKIFIANNEIHLLCHDNGTWLHRQTNEKGNILKQRQIHTTTKFFREILSLSFDEDSYLLAQENGAIIIERIDTDGNGSVTELIAFPYPFYVTWLPVKIADDTYITRFITEFGNGWLTTKNDQLIELFYGKDVRGYKNLVTGAVLALDYDKLVLSVINKTTENAYAAVFYPKVERLEKNTKLIVLNRKIDV